jgi:uncharacterized protein YceK
MRDKPIRAGVLAVMLGTLALAGCSSVAELPFPKLGEIVPADGPSLSPEQRAAVIEDLKKEQQTHEAEATKAIETR